MASAWQVQDAKHATLTWTLHPLSYVAQVSAGGSLANSLVGLARLGTPRMSSSPLRVAMAGCVGGTDALGTFARGQLQQAGVEVLSACPSGQTTGTVMVLSTPDAQRSFLSCFSNEDSVQLTPELQHAVACSKLLVIEGYLWELPGAAEILPELVQLARSVGTLVALTAGDAGVVQRHGGKVLETLAAGVDIWFCNAAEAEALLGHLPAQQQQPAAAAVSEQQAVSSSSNSSSKDAGLSVQQVAQQLSHLCPMMVVTDGSKGSYVTAFDELLVVPPYWSTDPPVDTTGAGDAYAAGFLYALLAGADLVTLGQSAARTASAVISRHGPQLLLEDAAMVVQAVAGAVAGGAAAASEQGVGLRGLLGGRATVLGGQAGPDAFPTGPSGLLAGPQV